MTAAELRELSPEALVARLDDIGNDDAPEAQPIKAELRERLYQYRRAARRAHERATLPAVLQPAYDVLNPLVEAEGVHVQWDTVIGSCLYHPQELQLVRPVFDRLRPRQKLLIMCGLPLAAVIAYELALLGVGWLGPFFAALAAAVAAVAFVCAVITFLVLPHAVQ